MASSAVARVVVELRLDGDGLVGTVGPDDGPATPFSGWLELLALLEAATESETPIEAGCGSAEPDNA